jgi:hypothetical protein
LTRRNLQRAGTAIFCLQNFRTFKGGKLERGTPRKTPEGFTFPLFRKPLILLTWCTPALGTTQLSIENLS